MQVAELKYIDPISSAKMGFLIGLFLGVIFSLISFLLSFFTLGSGFTVLLFLIPVIYAILGLVLGFVIAYLYNLFAKKFGGVKLGFK
jgi:hypothetical protein